MRILAISAHPDDETFGCGGTLLRHHAAGDEIYWLIMTKISDAQGYSHEKISSRQQEIQAVARRFGMTNVFQMDWLTTRLDSFPIGDMVPIISQTFSRVQPQVVYLPFPGDVHSDHRITFEIGSTCIKSFRHPYVRQVLCYEAVSETEFNFNPNHPAFRPNYFVDISEYLQEKIDISRIYASEMGVFPFPRSIEAVEALASHRGSIIGCRAAEAFMLLYAAVKGDKSE